MNYFSLGSKLDYPDLNALVYLLRKFKRLTSTLKLGSNSISSDYGTYTVTGGLTSVGGNFILEDTVTISSSDVLLNCFYTFHFTVVDVNLSGTVNRRVVSVTGDTGDNGRLEVVLEPSLLESDEVILPDFKVDIVFDEHEYYTPVSALDITLTVDKEYVGVGEVATITATVLDDVGSPVEDLELGFNINGSVVSDVTDESGVASVEYTGTGVGLVNVAVMGEKVKFYDGGVVVAEFTGNSITLGQYASNYGEKWLLSNGNVIIDWGDGTSDTVNNPIAKLTHTYSDGEQSHSIVFLGTVTCLGWGCFRNCTGLTSVTIPDSVTILETFCFSSCTGLTSVTIPDSVVSLEGACFDGCTGLTSVTIPDSVVSLGNYCFDGCTALIDYQLYWTGNGIIAYDSAKMPNNTDTIYTIPVGTTQNYISKSYPSNKLRERGLNLQITSDKPIIKSSETSTITATLTHEDTPLTSKTLNYQIKHGSTVITSGTKTTNSSGQATIQYTGTGVGEVEVIVSYDSLLQETYEIIDATYIDDGVNYLNRLTSTTVTGGIQLTAPVDNYGTMYFSETNNVSSTFYLPPNSVFEFDIIDYTGEFRIRCDSTSENQQLFTHTDVTAPCHVKIINKGTNIEYYIGGVRYNKTGVTSDNRKLTIRVDANSILTYNNLCYYGSIQPTPGPDTILVTGTGIIEKGDTDMLTACLLDGSTPVEGETLSYEIKHGATVIDSGSDTTDNNGEISISYTGTGIGDVDVIVSYGSSLQETYALEDCLKYGLKSTDTWHNVKSPNSGTYNNGEYYGYNKILDFDWDISTDWEITVDYKKAEYRCGLIILDETMTTSYDTSRYAFLWEKSANRVILEAKNSSNTLVINSQITKTMNYNQYYNIRIVKQGTTVTTYVDDVEVHSVTYVDVGINTANIGMFTWENRTGYMKNLKIKAL